MDRIVRPRAAARGAAGADCVEAPLADVSDNVVQPERVQGACLPDRSRTGAPEIAARLNDPAVLPIEALRLRPVQRRRKLLPGEPGISGGLVPADAADRVISLPVGIRTDRPRMRS